MIKETILTILGAFLLQSVLCDDETGSSGTSYECFRLHPGFKECGLTGINGNWMTNFTCGDKDFTAKLEITSATIDGGSTNGKFSFWTKDGVSGSPSINGEHVVRGTVDMDSGGLTLLGIKWIVQPPNWGAMFSFLNGNFNAANQTIHATLRAIGDRVCNQEVFFVRLHEPITCENSGMCMTNGSTPEDQICCCAKGYTGQTCDVFNAPDTTTPNTTTVRTTSSETGVTTLTSLTHVTQAELTMAPKTQNTPVSKTHTSPKSNATPEMQEPTIGKKTPISTIKTPVPSSTNTMKQWRYFKSAIIIHMLHAFYFRVLT